MHYAQLVDIPCLNHLHITAAGEKVLGQSAYDALDINRLDLSGSGLGPG